jgi:hypothetical protein
MVPVRLMAMEPKATAPRSARARLRNSSDGSKT